AATNKIKVIYHNLNLATLLAILLPAPLIKTTFNQNWATFLHILCNHLTLATPCDTVNKTDLLLRRTILALPSSVYCQCEVCHALAIWCLTRFRITRQVTHQNYLIK